MAGFRGEGVSMTTKHTPQELLKNFVFGKRNTHFTLKQGLAWLKPHVSELEAIHFLIDPLDPSCWRKKKYFHINKEETCSRLDEWIYRNLLNDNAKNMEYGKYLDQYRPLLRAGKIKDIDQYIMNKHYRPKAVQVLGQKTSFNKLLWSQRRNCMEYRRRTNIWTKDGQELRLAETFFIRNHNGNKEIIGTGSSSGSFLRQVGTFYTAIFYLLGKKHRIPQYVLRYNNFNEFEYVGRYYRIIVQGYFGANFELDRSLRNEIWEKGIYLPEKFERRY